MIAQPRLDLVLMMAQRWKLVALFAILGAVGGLAYGFVAPKWYQARLTVVPSQRTSGPMGMLSSLPGADALGVAGSTDVQRIQAVLDSDSVVDEVIAKFHLEERYDTSHPEMTRAALRDHCSMSSDRRSGVVALTCEDKDPEYAQQITAFFGEVGNRVFGRISVSSAREERKFLEGQVVKARKDVEDSSRRLREFQEQHRVIDLGEQSKAVISAMATVEGQLVSKQLELSYLSSFSSRTESNVIQLQQQIQIMQAKLAQLEDSRHQLATPPPAAGSAVGSDDSKFFPEAMRVPALRLQLEELLREQKIQETIFFLMTQRYETAKVDEARDTSTFQILDHPTLPTYKSRPRRLRIAMMGLAFGLAAGAAMVIGPVAWRRRRAAMDVRVDSR